MTPLLPVNFINYKNWRNPQLPEEHFMKYAFSTDSIIPRLKELNIPFYYIRDDEESGDPALIHPGRPWANYSGEIILTSEKLDFPTDGAMKNTIDVDEFVNNSANLEVGAKHFIARTPSDDKTIKNWRKPS